MYGRKIVAVIAGRGSDAGGERDFSKRFVGLALFEVSTCEILSYVVEQFDTPGLLVAGDDDEKLLTAPATDEVRLATGRQRRGDHFENAIADSVAVTVIERLEVIDVAQADRAFHTAARELLQVALDGAEEGLEPPTRGL